MSTIIVYTDGGAKGNPGPAGAGAVIINEDGNVLKKASKFLGTQTNNYAEYEAVILGLETLKKMLGNKKLADAKVEVKLDSELVTRQLNGEYQIKEPTLFPQFIKIFNLRVKYFKNISFTHVTRDKNQAADELANIAMDNKTDSLF